MVDLIITKEDRTITLHKPYFTVENENCRKKDTNIHVPLLLPSDVDEIIEYSSDPEGSDSESNSYLDSDSSSDSDSDSKSKSDPDSESN